MKLGETDASRRRIGPLKAVDAADVPVEDFSASGAALFSANNAAWEDAAGAVVVIANPDDSPSGLVYYQADEAEAAQQGPASLRLADVCVEAVFTEWIEPLPQGIPAGTDDDTLLHVGPLAAKDAEGNPITGGAGLEVHITINGAQLQVPANAITEILDGVTERGFYDLLLDPSEVTEVGWVLVRLGGACQEFTLRVDVVDPANMVSGSAAPTAPVPHEGAQVIERVASGDLALSWVTELGVADVSLVDYDSDLATDKGLMTAVLLSLFTDRRAEVDDVPPSGDPTDRRGWWADEFAAVRGDKFGSRLWLLDRSKSTNETALRAKEYINEALAWMIEDRVIASVDVAVERTGAALWITVGLNRPGRDQVSFRFAHTWDNLQEAA